MILSRPVPGWLVLRRGPPHPPSSPCPPRPLGTPTPDGTHEPREEDDTVFPTNPLSVGVRRSNVPWSRTVVPPGPLKGVPFGHVVGPFRLPHSPSVRHRGTVTYWSRSAKTGTRAERARQLTPHRRPGAPQMPNGPSFCLYFPVQPFGRTETPTDLYHGETPFRDASVEDRTGPYTPRGRVLSAKDPDCNRGPSANGPSRTRPGKTGHVYRVGIDADRVRSFYDRPRRGAVPPPAATLQPPERRPVT